MKILLISYDYFRYDGRVRELINVAKDLGDVTYITRGDGDEQPQEKQHIVYKDHGYMDFIRFCSRQAKKLGKLDLIFIDNRLPGALQHPQCIRYPGKDWLSGGKNVYQTF